MTRTMFDTQTPKVTRVRVLVGENNDATRRGGKKLVAWSECTYYCPDTATVERCVEALRESDERLRARPEELMLWDWQSTFFQADTDNEAGGGTVLLGVAWYDEEFYLDRRDAWYGGTRSMPMVPAVLMTVWSVASRRSRSAGAKRWAK
jgi:hypothetical protein